MNTNITSYVKQKAIEFGFDSVGVSCAKALDEEAFSLEKWLKENRNGEMKYMENYFDKRINPKLLMEDCKSVISLVYKYFPE